MSRKPVALVTVCSKGIGRAIALALADDGYDLALNDLASQTTALEQLSADISRKGRAALIVPADVSREEDVSEMIKGTVDGLGGLDVMVANAGVCFIGSIVNTPINEFDRIMKINVRGVYLCYQYAAKEMIAQGRGGRIIGAASTAGVSSDWWETDYGASKAAIRGLTQGAAKDLGKYGITVNCYAPGFIETVMLHQVAERPDGDGTVNQLAGRSVLNRVGEPEDVAALVCFLASLKAKFITGQTHMVNGGSICL